MRKRTLDGGRPPRTPGGRSAPSRAGVTGRVRKFGSARGWTVTARAWTCHSGTSTDIGPYAERSAPLSAGHIRQLWSDDRFGWRCRAVIQDLLTFQNTGTALSGPRSGCCDTLTEAGPGQVARTAPFRTRAPGSVRPISCGQHLRWRPSRRCETPPSSRHWASRTRHPCRCRGDWWRTPDPGEAPFLRIEPIGHGRRRARPERMRDHAGRHP